MQQTVAREHFRDAMARVGAAVHIVTTDGPAGRAGFTASAVCSVTDTPPTLLACLNRGASVYPAFTTNGVLCVNTLGHTHEDISGLFGGKTSMEERFASGAWVASTTTGAPMLKDAIMSFDCRITQTLNVGSHDIMICAVVGCAAGSGTEALFYFDRRYHRLG